jgi:hypothetical protein
VSGNTTLSTDRLLRARLIASGRLRPNTNELDPVQLPPGTVVFRLVPEVMQ